MQPAATAGEDADAMHREATGFSIAAGGPFASVARRLHLGRPPSSLLARRLIMITWFPIVLGALVRFAIVGEPDPIVRDISIHTRFLIALPVLLFATGLLDITVRSAVVQLYEGNVADPAVIDRILARAARQRDSRWAELAFAVIALFAGQLTLSHLLGPAGVFGGITLAETSFARIWYATIALPLLHFLTLRWLWRWVIWCGVLWKVSRISLSTIATHPDRACGLRFLIAPVTAFAVFELGMMSVLSGAWATQLFAGRATVPSLLPTFFTEIVVALVISCGPLLWFTPHLMRRQRETLVAYHPLSFDYVRRFHAKWIVGRDRSELLGTPDIQSLADLANSYRVAEETSIFLVNTRKLIELWLAAIIPVLPLAAIVVPIDQLLRRVGSAMFGGFLP